MGFTNWQYLCSLFITIEKLHTNVTNNFTVVSKLDLPNTLSVDGLHNVCLDSSGTLLKQSQPVICSSLVTLRLYYISVLPNFCSTAAHFLGTDHQTAHCIYDT